MMITSDTKMIMAMPTTKVDLSVFCQQAHSSICDKSLQYTSTGPHDGICSIAVLCSTFSVPV
eukprot:3736093-Ditylum_brightwellii.AAC.1